jgi:hypothetical protein|tara:strand:- start:352 stop:495 length:144 start_codon:yes stop_codon:yes gene_type:complete
MVEIIITSIIWLVALLSLKMYKDKIIYMHKEKMRMMEEAWIKEQKKK